MIAPERVSTSRSKSAKGKWVGKVHDYVIACNSLKRNISQKVVEDFESRQLQAVSFVVDRGKEIQDWNEQRLPKMLPGYSGGRLPGRSAKEQVCVTRNRCERNQRTEESVTEEIEGKTEHRCGGRY